MDPSLAPPALIGDSSYEIFDPLSWALDGLIDFPFGYSDSQNMT